MTEIPEVEVSETVTTQVKGVYSRQAGNSTIYDVKSVDDVQYNTWDKDLAERIQKTMLNQPVVIEFETSQRQSGDRTFTNRNIKSVTLVSGGAAPQPTAIGPDPSVAAKADAKEASIKRQVALKAAAAVYNGSGIEADQVIAYAKQLDGYLNESEVLDALAEVGAEEVAP